FGFVKGDRIACLYHGWEYDGAAQCRYIPAHPELDVPATIRVATWPVAEAAGMVWVARAAAEPPPDIPATGLRSLFLDAPVDVTAAHLASGLPGLGAATASDAGAVRRIEQGGAVLLAGLHPIGPSSSAVHIAVEGAADAATLDRLARAAEAFRRSVEGTGAAA
ncbi:MAG: Rieske 2Fe-2S domain-containing protein, partial [Gemmobacter sp.]